MIGRDELYMIFKEGVKAGALAAMKATSPTSDLIKAKDIKRWCTMNYVDFALFKKLRDEGKIHPIKKGSAPNSPIMYSLSEISLVVGAERTYRILWDDGAPSIRKGKCAK